METPHFTRGKITRRWKNINDNWFLWCHVNFLRVGLCECEKKCSSRVNENENHFVMLNCKQRQEWWKWGNIIEWERKKKTHLWGRKINVREKWTWKVSVWNAWVSWIKVGQTAVMRIKATALNVVEFCYGSGASYWSFIFIFSKYLVTLLDENFGYCV